ncbi:hypothetical protein SAMN05216326_1532 [Nitrosomonas marina]|uniref:Uncharacterized protein n=1 Tax=Nitrosomonas marina TaxID=917 RepID=A0A1I0G408_9PROT|nr:hypothetical protein [Nitrosomonas marina]SET65469.1 hypothetical protein SAMN05216326_1532 [Nitrosomonas marina]
MSFKMIKKFLVSVVVASGIIFSGQLYAHGGLSLEDDLCVLTVGPYRIHFTGYQPMSQEQEFCEDIPEIGKTVVALDYINDELRPFATEVRIVRSATPLNITTSTTPKDLEKVSDEDLENMTIYHLPPEVYPNATILVEHSFQEKGMFAGVVTVKGNDQEWVSVFPFAVGQGLPINWFTDVLPYVALVAFAAFFFLRSRKKPKEEGTAA